MKRYVCPLLLLAAVFTTTICCQPFTILRQEGLGLFLNTPDFYRALLFDPFPLSNLIGSFLVQFYSSIYAGAAIVALMVCAVYLLVKAISSRIGFCMEPLNLACAGAAWFFIAKAANPSMGIAIILILSAILVLMPLFFRKREVKVALKPFVGILSSCAVLAAAVMTLVLNPSIKEGEKWSAVEFAAVQGEWDYLLKYATPQAAHEDMQLSPYALLALNAQCRLSSGVAEYPVMEDFGIDYGSEITYRRSLFDAVLYSNLGCHNEAIHRTHQCGDFLPHGTSFRTLRMLVKENHAIGDSLMVVKYCDILDKSLLHKEFTSYFRNNPCPRRVLNTPEESSKALLITTTDPMEILLRLGRVGINNPMIMDRYYTYYQIREYFKEHKK